MLFKAIVLETLVAAAAVSAQNATVTPVTPVEVAVNAAKKTHTPLAQCPGRSKVYVALSKYSAPASFCSSFMNLNGGTKTVTSTGPGVTASPITTTETIDTTSIVTRTTTETVTTTTTSGLLARCTAGGPNMRRDVSADSLAKSSAAASASTKAKLPRQLKNFKTKALSSACSCMGYNKASSGKTVTVTAPGASASASIKTNQVTQKATTTTLVTVTSTITATVTSQVAGIDGAMFAIMATDTDTNYDGIYLALTGESINRAAFSANNIADASDFQIDANNDLTEYDNQSSAISIANQDAGNPCEPVYFDTSLSDAAVPLTCCVDDSSDLQCGNTNGASQFSLGTDTGLLYFCQANQTANFAQLKPVRMAVQLLD